MDSLLQLQLASWFATISKYSLQLVEFIKNCYFEKPLMLRHYTTTWTIYMKFASFKRFDKFVTLGILCAIQYFFKIILMDSLLQLPLANSK